MKRKCPISRRNVENCPELESKLLKCVLESTQISPKSGKKGMKISRIGAKRINRICKNSKVRIQKHFFWIFCMLQENMFML